MTELLCLFSFSLMFLFLPHLPLKSFPHLFYIFFTYLPAFFHSLLLIVLSPWTACGCLAAWTSLVGRWMCWGQQGGAIGHCLSGLPLGVRPGTAGYCKCCTINGAYTLLPIVKCLLTIALSNLPPWHIGPQQAHRTTPPYVCVHIQWAVHQYYYK